MTTTADTLTDSRSIEDIGRCVACGSTAGGLWGCCFVCGCPTPEWQRRTLAQQEVKKVKGPVNPL
jgi:hypothetical protein